MLHGMCYVSVFHEKRGMQKEIEDIKDIEEGGESNME